MIKNLCRRKCVKNDQIIWRAHVIREQEERGDLLPNITWIKREIIHESNNCKWPRGFVVGKFQIIDCSVSVMTSLVSSWPRLERIRRKSGIQRTVNEFAMKILWLQVSPPWLVSCRRMGRGKFLMKKRPRVCRARECFGSRSSTLLNCRDFLLREQERGKTFLITIINKRAKQNLIRGFSAINLQLEVVIRILSFAQLRFSLSLEISPLAPLKLNAFRDPSQKLNEFRCGFDLEYTAENAQHTSWHNLLRHRLECVVTLQFSSVLHVVVRRLVADVIKRTVFVYIICQWTISPIFMVKLYST